MPTLLLIRHGESESNVGLTNDPNSKLTENGREQARRLGKELANRDLTGFMCLVSPYGRCQETAAIISEETGLTFWTNSEVREWGGTTTIGDACFEHEELPLVCERLTRFWNATTDDKLLIVTHATPLIVLQRLSEKRPLEGGDKLWGGVGNCVPYWIEFARGNMFQKSFVINLPFKTDRLESFMAAYPKSLPPVQVWPAVHGDSIRHPDWWTSGSGAWGCYRSHLQIMEYCYQHKIESYLVLEDDAIFRDGFDGLLAKFMSELPDDWQQVYLGGQLLHCDQRPVRRVNEHVLIPPNVNRTHAFAVHQRGYEVLYKHLNERMIPGDHIDHWIGRLHDDSRIKVYVPNRWLCGQGEGSSNISGNYNQATFYIDPEFYCSETQAMHANRVIPAIYLEATLDLAKTLGRHGWHRGKWLDHQGLDRGVINALESASVEGGLKSWYNAVMPEAVREGLSCVCLHHHKLTLEIVNKLEFAKFHHIKATTVEEAQQQLDAILNNTAPQEAVKPKRNLIYHIWPKKGNGTWQWNVAELLRRIDQFDGLRSIAVATDDATDSVDDVKAAFAGVRVDNWIVVPNDPKLGEVATFKQLLTTVAMQSLVALSGGGRDTSITFYAHAKGVKYDDNQNVKDWASIMYEVCLDDQEYVNASLAQFPVTGPFKNNREYKGEMKYGWHYSGTFFWFRNTEVFKREWQQIDQSYYGSEKWIGNLFEEKEAGDLFGGHVGWLYHVGEMHKVRGMLNEWRSKDKNRPPQKPIPIYINARNLLTPLKAMVEYLRQIPNARPIIVDNDSTWQPLLDWYDKECPVEVIRTGVNGGKFGWSKHLLDHAALGIEKYVVTDSDLDLSNVPLDVLEVLALGLDCNAACSKCGLSLDIDQIPDEYKQKEDVFKWESQFWRHRTNGWCHAGIDTTFSMRRADDPIALETHGHLRRDRPYTASHWPWTWTPEFIEQSEEVRHYIATADPVVLHWTPMITTPDLTTA